MPLIVLYLPKLRTDERVYDIIDIIGLDQTKHYTILNQDEIYTLNRNNDPKLFIPGQIRCILMAYQLECGLIFIWDKYGVQEIKSAMAFAWYGIPGYDYDTNPNNILGPIRNAMRLYNGEEINNYGIHFINDIQLYEHWNPDNYDWTIISSTPNFKIGKTICND